MTRRGEELIQLAARLTAAQRELSQISRQLDNYHLAGAGNVVIQVNSSLNDVYNSLHRAIGQEATK